MAEKEDTAVTVKLKPRSGERKAKAIVDAVIDIQTKPVPDIDDMAWGAKCLVAASLPYRSPKPDQLQNGCWVRKNGNHTLWIQPCPGMSLPYGSYPRIFMIWLTSEAIRTGSQNISIGGSFAEFCKKIQIDTSRGKAGAGRRFIEQVDLMLSSRAAFIKGSFDEGRIEKDMLQFSDSYTLWFDVNKPTQPSLFESSIHLTEKFFTEITQHSIALDIRAVNSLRQSPMELDIYQWLAYRMYSLKGAAAPTWEQLRMQFGSSHSRMVDFRRDFLKALHAVKQVYGSARVEQIDKGLLLLPSPTPVPKKLK